MGIMAYSSLWVMQDVYHQPYHMDVRRGYDVACSLKVPFQLPKLPWPQQEYRGGGGP